MNEDQIKRAAEQAFVQTRMSAEEIAFYGEDEQILRRRFPNAFANLVDFENHIRTCNEVNEQTGAMLDWQRFPLGTTHEQFVADAEAKLKARRRGAGARALARKYGREEAEAIIARKTGRHVSLRG